jgi:hypothetical protein
MTIVDIYVENKTCQDIAVALLCDVDVENSNGSLVYWRIVKISGKGGTPAKIPYNMNEFEMVAWLNNTSAHTPVVQNVQPGDTAKIILDPNGYPEFGDIDTVKAASSLTGKNQTSSILGIALADCKGYLLAVQEGVLGKTTALFTPKHTLYVMQVSLDIIAADKYHFIKNQLTKKQTLETDKVANESLGKYVGQGVTISCIIDKDNAFSFTFNSGEPQ